MTLFSCLQVELVGMSFIGLKAVVDFLYSGELPLDGGNIDSVLEAAHLLQVTVGLGLQAEHGPPAEVSVGRQAVTSSVTHRSDCEG